MKREKETEAEDCEEDRAKEFEERMSDEGGAQEFEAERSEKNEERKSLRRQRLLQVNEIVTASMRRKEIVRTK